MRDEYVYSRSFLSPGPPHDQGYPPGEGKRRKFRLIQREGKLMPSKMGSWFPTVMSVNAQRRELPRKEVKRANFLKRHLPPKSREEAIIAHPLLSLTIPTNPSGLHFTGRETEAKPHFILQDPITPNCIRLTDPTTTPNLLAHAQP